jgi:hypothetical protein
MERLWQGPSPKERSQFALMATAGNSLEAIKLRAWHWKIWADVQNFVGWKQEPILHTRPLNSQLPHQRCSRLERFLKVEEKKFRSPGATPTIVSYNASAVKIYNAAGSLCSAFENKTIFLCFEKALAYYVQRRQIPKSNEYCILIPVLFCIFPLFYTGDKICRSYRFTRSISTYFHSLPVYSRYDGILSLHWYPRRSQRLPHCLAFF